jgi:hypothetical protein
MYNFHLILSKKKILYILFLWKINIYQMTNLLINNNHSLNNQTNNYSKKKYSEQELEKDSDDELEKELEKELELIIANKPIIDIILSKEQENIINSKSNIIVDAVAGSGKTTTILHMGLKYPDKNIFQITYNNMLKREVRKKVNRLCITNMNIHTYHSLAVGYYDPNSFTDEEIKKILIENKPLKNQTHISPIDILFIDESQDMIFDYYNLIKKFITDTKSNPQIIVLGDRYQGIYDFKGADVKFLTLADKIWHKPFTKLSLTQSYRLTDQIGWFVNNIMLGYNRIYTNKIGPPIDYYIANSFEVYKKIGKYIRNIIAFENILPSDIFVLVPSLKTDGSPYKKLENYLVKYGIKCTTPLSDDAKLDEKIISNKIVFTTYHQSKGRERKVVILYNFDDSFLDFYSKDANSNTNSNIITCPNILYVGVTRAIYKLILIQDSRYKPLRFLNLNKLKSNTYVKIITLDKQNIAKIDLSKNQDIKKISVTDLVKFISSKTIENLIKLVDTNLFEEITPSSKQIEIPNKIKIESGNTILWEDVSDLNGLVIPAIYEANLKNTNSTIENYVFEKIQDVEIYNNVKKYSGKINIPAKNINDYLKIGNIYLSIQNKLHAKLAQIKKYNWLTKQIIKDCHKLMKMIDESTKFEIPISNCDTDYIDFSHPVFGTIYLKGRLDAITDTDVWEFKCVDCISIEHKLQIIIYCWMWNKSNYDDTYGKKNFYLLNIKSGQILKLNYTGKTYIIDEIVEILFNEKYIKKKYINDSEFIKLCNNN